MKANVFENIQDLFYGISNYTFNILQVNNQTNRAILTHYIKEKYGVDNVFQSEIIKQKIKDRCLADHGAEFYAQTDFVTQSI